MAVYLISCDVTAGPHDDKLDTAIRRDGGERVLESQWIIESPVSAAVIWDRLRRMVNEGDRILVAEIAQNAEWSGGNLLITDDRMNTYRMAARGEPA